MATMAKGGPELLQDPVAQELLASRIPARLAYTWTDGTPRVVSIWFHWDGTDLVMGTLPGAPKLKALHTGDRVAITIDTNAHPIMCYRSAGRPRSPRPRASSLSTPRRPSAISARSRARPTLGRCRRPSGWAASRCVPSRWWSWTSRPGSRLRCRRWDRRNGQLGPMASPTGSFGGGPPTLPTPS
jgi:hypothetical protein